MRSPALVAGALICALAVAAGAFGAHALRSRLGPDALALWETAARYLMYGGLGLALIGAVGLQLPRPGLGPAGALLGGGALLFSGSLGALALGAPRWLGAVTPVGGLLIVLGFLWLAWIVARG
jgi:uncharacterized membrane protein YgdD (TMEM256/DUF423 family)